MFGDSKKLDPVLPAYNRTHQKRRALVEFEPTIRSSVRGECSNRLSYQGSRLSFESQLDGFSHIGKIELIN